MERSEMVAAAADALRPVLFASAQEGEDSHLFDRMQFLAYMLNGALMSTVHGSDMDDTLISEAMLFSANKHLNKDQAQRLCNLAEQLSLDLKSALGV